MFEELDAMFATHLHYYIVNLPTMNDALEMCARVAIGNPQVIMYKGQLILASQSAIGSNISWLTEVPRPPEPEQLEAPTE